MNKRIRSQVPQTGPQREHRLLRALVPEEKGTAIYHEIRAHENYETAAAMLWALVRRASIAAPGKPRFLYLDIEGHRNIAGGFDAEMLELQTAFITGRLARYLTEAYLPLFTELGQYVRCSAQAEDMPEHPVPWTEAEREAWKGTR